MGAADPTLHVWDFNGDVKNPTFTPSLHIFKAAGHYDNNGRWHETGKRITRCHLNLIDGELIYHNDSPHALAGQTVPLEDIPLTH